MNAPEMGWQGPPKNESARRSRCGEPEHKRFTSNYSGSTRRPPLASSQATALRLLRRQLSDAGRERTGTADG
jgi:hypothetical protein